MGWFSDDSDQAQAYNDYNNNGVDQNQPHLSHELIAGAASYEAAKAYENHCAENGQPGSHAEAKEIMAGFAGAFIDREVETKGMDFIDAKPGSTSTMCPQINVDIKRCSGVGIDNSFLGGCHVKDQQLVGLNEN